MSELAVAKGTRRAAVVGSYTAFRGIAEVSVAWMTVMDRLAEIKHIAEDVNRRADIVANSLPKLGKSERRQQQAANRGKSE